MPAQNQKVLHCSSVIRLQLVVTNTEVVTHNKWNARDKYLESLKPEVRARAEVARMKGLGEMDADELNETTMDIETRVLRKITVDDLVSANSIFEKLMGDEVEPRREFIIENAGYALNLDV